MGFIDSIKKPPSDNNSEKRVEEAGIHCIASYRGRSLLLRLFPRCIRIGLFLRCGIHTRSTTLRFRWVSARLGIVHDVTKRVRKDNWMSCGRIPPISSTQTSARLPKSSRSAAPLGYETRRDLLIKVPLCNMRLNRDAKSNCTHTGASYYRVISDELQKQYES